MNIEPVANSNKCGFCRTLHGGTNHSCPVHGLVSQGCCETPCDPTEWVWVKGTGHEPKDKTGWEYRLGWHRIEQLHKTVA